MPPRSPLAPAQSPQLPAIAGVRLATICSGMRYKGRDDVALIVLDPGTTAAGTFTRSLTAAPPVEWCRRVAKRGKARAVLVNAGNANAFTGKHGRAAVSASAAAVAKLLKCKPDEVFCSSTGVIGVKLPVDKLVATLPQLAGSLSGAAWDKGAAAIMTTDTFPKLATRTAEIAGTRVTINGIAKGSGKIGRAHV